MTAKTQKPQPVVTVTILPGKATERQKKLWRTLWTRLLATVQSELKTENEAKR